jgi:serine/threonine protein kinase
LNLSKNNIIDNKKFDQFLDKHKKNEYYPNVSVLISEWASEGDLLDYIRKKYKTFKIRHWRTIFFQLLSVLAVIQAKYPDFRHNDLKANNLLVDSLDTSTKKYKYSINGETYNVPNIGFQIKLWDFDFACIPNIIRNSKVEADWTSKININPVQNRYYDVHYFFNTFTRKGFFPEFWTEPEIDDKVRKFVRRVVPEKFASGKNVTEKGRILINEEYLTPDQILKEDSFFKVMRESSYNKDKD